jgi:hypothetical protein
MATLGRSLKSSSYLSRARRPGMSPRALSNSSDVSVASAGSNRSEDQLDFVMSAANTPFGELSQAEAMAPSSVPPEAPQHQLQQRQLSRGKSLVSLFPLGRLPAPSRRLVCSRRSSDGAATPPRGFDASLGARASVAR